GAAAQVPSTPRDGAVIKDLNSPTQWQIAGGARFPLSDPAVVDALKNAGQLKEVWVVPDGGVEQVPLTPRDRAHFKELGSDTEWEIAGGARFPLPGPETRDSLVHGGHLDEHAYTVTAGAMQQVPSVPRDGTLF